MSVNIYVKGKNNNIWKMWLLGLLLDKWSGSHKDNGKQSWQRGYWLKQDSEVDEWFF